MTDITQSVALCSMNSCTLLMVGSSTSEGKARRPQLPLGQTDQQHQKVAAAEDRGKSVPMHGLVIRQQCVPKNVYRNAGVYRN